MIHMGVCVEDGCQAEAVVGAIRQHRLCLGSVDRRRLSGLAVDQEPYEVVLPHGDLVDLDSAPGDGKRGYGLRYDMCHRC